MNINELLNLLTAGSEDDEGEFIVQGDLLYNLLKCFFEVKFGKDIAKLERVREREEGDINGKCM